MNSKTKNYSMVKPEAIKLRHNGKSFSEIQKELGKIPKSTLTGWLKNVKLNDEQLSRIRKIQIDKGHAGRQLGAWQNKQKRLERLESIRKEAKEEYPALSKQPLFLSGLVLYLAEGTKKSEVFHFMNSDPYLIKLMLGWIIKVSELNISDVKFRLYIHELYASEDCEQFWKNRLGVTSRQFQKTIYKPTGRKYKKNPDYKGCLRIEISGSRLYWKTMTWRDCFYKSLS